MQRKQVNMSQDDLVRTLPTVMKNLHCSAHSLLVFFNENPALVSPCREQINALAIAVIAANLWISQAARVAIAQNSRKADA
jgi:hypothetical protein